MLYSSYGLDVAVCVKSSLGREGLLHGSHLHTLDEGLRLVADHPSTRIGLAVTLLLLLNRTRTDEVAHPPNCELSKSTHAARTGRPNLSCRDVQRYDLCRGTT